MPLNLLSGKRIVAVGVKPSSLITVGENESPRSSSFTVISIVLPVSPNELAESVTACEPSAMASSTAVTRTDAETSPSGIVTVEGTDIWPASVLPRSTIRSPRVLSKLRYTVSVADPDGSLISIGNTPLASPRDLDFSRNGRFLYAVSPTGRVTGYRVGSDGSLEQVTSVPGAAGLTGAAAG